MTPKDPLNILAAEGSIPILSYLWEKWGNSKKNSISSPATTFKTLNKVVKTTRTLRDRLNELRTIGLVKKEGRNYSLTDLGIVFYPTIQKVEMVGIKDRDPLELPGNHRSLCRETGAIIMAAKQKGEILLTTRKLTSLLIPDVHDELYPLLKAAVKRGVKIQVIADPSISKQVRKILIEKLKATVKYLSSDFLENPPGVLKPVFVEDFSHILISDRKHWLALRPHKKEGEHYGRRCFNDPITAEYLADIFDTFWKLADVINWNHSLI